MTKITVTKKELPLIRLFSIIFGILLVIVSLLLSHVGAKELAIVFVAFALGWTVQNIIQQLFLDELDDEEETEET